jgi:hypothetical protein
MTILHYWSLFAHNLFCSVSPSYSKDTAGNTSRHAGVPLEEGWIKEAECGATEEHIILGKRYRIQWNKSKKNGG